MKPRAAQISDLDERIRDVIGAALVAGSNVTITVDDPGDTITIAAAGGSSYTDEQVRDVIGAALVAGSGMTVTVNDPGDTITLASTGGSGGIAVGTSDPGSPATGYAYLNTSLGQLRVWSGTAWWAVNMINPYTATILADNPWAFWLLAETSGTTFADASPNAHPASLSGSAHTFAQTGPGSSLSKAVAFSTAAGYANTSATVTLSTASVEAWVYLTANPAATTGVVAFAQNYNNATRDKELFIETDGKVGWHVYNGTAQVLYSPSALSLNAWHHIVGTIGPTGGQKIYVDGTNVATNGAVTTSFTTVAQQVILRGGGSGFAGTGAMTIAGPAVYASELSAAQVTAHHAAV